MCPKCGAELAYGEKMKHYCIRCGLCMEDHEQKMGQLKRYIIGKTHSIVNTKQIMVEVEKVIRND